MAIAHPDPLEPSTPQAAVDLAEGHLHRGEPLLAYDAAKGGLRRWPQHLRLRQLQGLALARSGDTRRANQLLGAIVDEGHGDAETLGILARTHKDLALGASDGLLRARHLRAALDLYARAFDHAVRLGRAGDAGYTGINAAAMAVLGGDLPRGRALAGAVRRIRADDAVATRDERASYWREATLAEAALILGEHDVALAHYRRAAALGAAEHPGDLASTRRQARLLLAHLRVDPAAVLQALRLPPIVVFAGHMIDEPGRPVPRFPSAAEPAVRDALRAALAALGPLAVYGSAACGADLMCLEAARSLGAETHVVLPFPAPEFRRASVDFAPGDWGRRFEQALEAADTVTVASDHHARGSTATFEYANLILTGMGRLRAEVLDASLHALAVCEPGSTGAAGGTASLLGLWQAQGLPIERVGLPPLAAGAPEARAASQEAVPGLEHAPVGRHELRALLFADAVGFSHLSEDQIAGFIGGFLESVAALNRRTVHRFEHVETAGDGIYMVFEEASAAGSYALELSQLVREFDRRAWGLPPDFDLRIALHCGPVHCARDPITGGKLYTGPHASRAARIEPITPPGQVYASGAFAAVAAATGAPGILLDYVGLTPLAKSYGTIALYCIRPRA